MTTELSPESPVQILWLAWQCCQSTVPVIPTSPPFNVVGLSHWSGLREQEDRQCCCTSRMPEDVVEDGDDQIRIMDRTGRTHSDEPWWMPLGLVEHVVIDSLVVRPQHDNVPTGER
uniref:(northern house mosquito) hypothetical protein n=1 Tax=Culex pipiens TaxID=7175 RepID=A0A8D8AXZ6_CULPI